MTSTAPPELEAFIAREFPKLVRMLDMLTGDVHLAEELAQEALIRTSSRWDTVRKLDFPAAWTRRVARNLATSRWRRTQAARRAAVRIGPVDVVHTDRDLTVVHEVRDALQRLSHDDRVVLVLRHTLEMSVAETASELGLTEAAVTSRTHRAANRLRVLLDPTHDTRESADV